MFHAFLEPVLDLAATQRTFKYVGSGSGVKRRLQQVAVEIMRLLPAILIACICLSAEAAPKKHKVEKSAPVTEVSQKDTTPPPTETHTQTRFISDVKAIYPGQKFWVALHLRMPAGWHTYWKNPGDSGMAAIFRWTLPKRFIASDIGYPAPITLPYSDLIDYGYENEAWLLTSITAPSILPAGSVSILTLNARWLVCKNVCIPESGTFSISLPDAVSGSTASAEADEIAAQVAKLPTALNPTLDYYVSGNQIRFDFPLGNISADNITSAEYFPEDQGVILNKADQNIDIKSDALGFTLTKDTGVMPEKTVGLVSLFFKNKERRDFEVKLKAGFSSAKLFHDIVGAMVLAFIGGLILNAMPCVFPVLSFKALAVVKKAEKHPREVKMHGIWYALGVIVSFLALAGLLISIQAGSKAFGWGYQLQSPLFVSFLAIVFFIMGLNLAGAFEVPSFFGSWGSDIKAGDTLFGSFLTGALAVTAATPCTAPFMAPAIGYALTQSAMVVMLVFASLGLGLAMPFLILSFSPSLIRALPKPGKWMVTFRQACAFPMYLCAIWLLWVLARQIGTKPMFIVLLSMVFITFSFWLSKLRASFTTLFGLLIAIATILLMIKMINPEHTEKETAQHEEFSQARIDVLRANGRGVFVDVTADWCITCKVNEHIALNSDAVQKALTDKNIVYMVADWTNNDKEIAAYLRSFGRAGVPLYVYYPPGHKDPVVLPQILIESAVLEAIQ